MVEENQVHTPATVLSKRKKGPKKSRGVKKMKIVPGMGKKNKINKKMQKLFRKRARDYNSDDSDDDDDDNEKNVHCSTGGDMETERDEGFVNDESDGSLDSGKEEQASDEEDEVQTGIMKFVEGCKAFRVAFQKIMKRHVDDETLGPVLSAHKKLVVAKLAEEDAERKFKGEAKKEKRLVEEKGHVKPANFLDSHEKFLIGVATKGAVKLFNAVNKVQNAQKGLNPSRFKDAKALTKRRKEAFLSELSRASGQSTGDSGKASESKGGEDSQPAWAPLQDTFMLTKSKLKDWDKMPVEQTEDI